MKRAECPVTLALVGCSKRKAKTPGEPYMPAKDLYIGRLCRMGYEHAMARGWDVLFLSALHGIVDPFTHLPPYDYSMINIPQSQRMQWGIGVVGELMELYPMLHLDIVFFAGKSYVDPIIDAGSIQDGYWAYENPLKGLDIFARMRWFKAHSTNVATPVLSPAKR